MHAHRHCKSTSDNRTKDINNHVKNIKQHFCSSSNKKNRSFIIKEKKKKRKPNILKRSYKLAYKELYKKYNCLNDDYELILVEHFLNNANTHLVSVFKDYMIMDYKEEFLIKYYKLKESNKRIPEFQIYYKNYLLFFCKPMIANLKLNDLLLDQEERKAELYYKQNYANNYNNSEIGFFDDNSKVSKIKYSNHTLFSESIRESIDKAKLTTENSKIISNSNSTLLLTYDSFKNEIEKINVSKSKNISNNSTLCDIINGFYNKRIYKVVQKNAKKESAKNLLKKISKEKIKNFLQKGCFSSSNLNNLLKLKHKKITSPIINNYKYKPQIKTLSREKNSNYQKANSHSKVKTTLSTSKSLIKSPTSKSRNNRNGLSSISRGNTNISNKTNTIYKSTISFNNSNSKQNIHLFKTQNVEKFLHKYHLSNSNNGNYSISKKKYISELSNNNYNKPVIKIQKWKKDLPKLSKLNNYSNNKLMNMALSLLLENNITLKKGYYNTNSNGNNNTTNNNNQNIISLKNLKETLNNKIKNNENITSNIKNNLKKFNKNSSSSLTKTNDKVITSYHTKSVKNFNLIIKKKKGSVTLHKSNSKRKAK